MADINLCVCLQVTAVSIFSKTLLAIMETTLKGKNKAWLAFVVFVNITGYLVLLHNGFAVEGWTEILASTQKLFPLFLIFILTGILNAQTSHNNKARLVFWKWLHPLPGSRAFTEYASMDARIDSDALQNHQNPLPTEPEKQNALWFKWYREFQTEPGILQVHREYLFTRDYACIAFLILFGLGPLAFWQMESVMVAGAYSIALLAQYLLVRRAARNHGVRFVTSVLAYKASSN